MTDLSKKVQQDIPNVIEAINNRKADVELSQQMMKESFEKEMKTINPYIEIEKPQLVSEYWPLHNMVLCSPHRIKRKTSGGIILDPNTVEEQEDKVINYSMGLKAVKVGPEVHNVKAGDTVFQSMPGQPMLVPLINDLAGETEVRRYHVVAENWITAVIREDAKAEDFVATPHPMASLLSTESK